MKNFNMNNFNMKPKLNMWKAFGSIIFLVIILHMFSAVILHFISDTVLVTVNDKERVNLNTDNIDPDETNVETYLVYTDTGTYKVADSYLMFRFNSADTYGTIKREHCYRLLVRGVRIGWISSYQNIDTATEINCNTINKK